MYKVIVKDFKKSTKQEKKCEIDELTSDLTSLSFLYGKQICRLNYTTIFDTMTDGYFFLNIALQYISLLAYYEPSTVLFTVDTNLFVLVITYITIFIKTAKYYRHSISLQCDLKNVYLITFLLNYLLNILLISTYLTMTSV